MQPSKVSPIDLTICEHSPSAEVGEANVGWLDDAACGSLPLDQLEVFFVKAGHTIGSTALALCQRCPVRPECLDHARRHDISYGYFGGVSPSARRAESRRQPVGALADAEASGDRISTDQAAP